MFITITAAGSGAQLESLLALCLVLAGWTLGGQHIVVSVDQVVVVLALQVAELFCRGSLAGREGPPIWWVNFVSSRRRRLFVYLARSSWSSLMKIIDI